jgi:hypothetical protein
MPDAHRPHPKAHWCWRRILVAVAAAMASAVPTSVKHGVNGEAALIANPSAPPLVRPHSTVVVGDLHGDIDVLEQVLLTAGITQARGGPWALPASHPVTLVQMGDMVDGFNRRSPATINCNASIAVVRRMMQLQEQARSRGSEVVAMLGNHEMMNMLGDYRCVSAGCGANVAANCPHSSRPLHARVVFLFSFKTNLNEAGAGAEEAQKASV